MFKCNRMKKQNTDMYETRIYCGTYSKYNEGSLSGKWIDLSDYCDKEEFYEACKTLHKDEEDPELMFQDWESPFDDLISESHINELIFDIYIEFKPNKFDALNTFLKESSKSYDDIKELASDFEDAYIGEYNSKVEFASEILDEQLYMIPEHLHGYLNYEAFARDLFMDGYSYINGYVFRF